MRPTVSGAFHEEIWSPVVVTKSGLSNWECWLVAVLHAGAVDEVLSEAMAPVLRDLRSAGIAASRIEDCDWTDDPESASVMLWSPDGSGTSIFVSRAAPEFEREAMVADQVQDWVIEELWGHGPTNWPRARVIRIATR